MGEAKRRRALMGEIVYHHTSILRTNLIWMSGVIELEGQGKSAYHPHLGYVGAGGASTRRACSDFPPLAWFTSRIQVPGVLRTIEVTPIDKVTGQPVVIPGWEEAVRETRQRCDLANEFTLNRVALGFPIVNIPVIRWQDHYGWQTPEGMELNKTACEAGDNPNDWYVSEVPVDVLAATQWWFAKSKNTARLERNDPYLADIRRMVNLCREQRAYIPPSWMSPETATTLAQKLGIPVSGYPADVERQLSMPAS